MTDRASQGSGGSVTAIATLAVKNEDIVQLLLRDLVVVDKNTGLASPNPDSTDLDEDLDTDELLDAISSRNPAGGHAGPEGANTSALAEAAALTFRRQTHNIRVVASLPLLETMGDAFASSGNTAVDLFMCVSDQNEALAMAREAKKDAEIITLIEYPGNEMFWGMGKSIKAMSAADLPLRLPGWALAEGQSKVKIKKHGEDNVAAVKLQAIFRGYFVRKALNLIKLSSHKTAGWGRISGKDEFALSKSGRVLTDVVGSDTITKQSNQPFIATIAGYTLAHLAAIGRKLDDLSELQSLGILKPILNELNVHGHTALSCAVCSKRAYPALSHQVTSPANKWDNDALPVVKFLLEHGADPNLADSDGLKPLDHARKSRLNRCVLVLEEWGEKSSGLTRVGPDGKIVMVSLSDVDGGVKTRPQSARAPRNLKPPQRKRPSSAQPRSTRRLTIPHTTQFLNNCKDAAYPKKLYMFSSEEGRDTYESWLEKKNETWLERAARLKAVKERRAQEREEDKIRKLNYAQQAFEAWKEQKCEQYRIERKEFERGQPMISPRTEEEQLEAFEEWLDNKKRAERLEKDKRDLKAKAMRADIDAMKEQRQAEAGSWSEWMAKKKEQEVEAKRQKKLLRKRSRMSSRRSKRNDHELSFGERPKFSSQRLRAQSRNKQHSLATLERLKI